MEIPEVIRRWPAEGKQRQIAEGTGRSRATVGQYLSPVPGRGDSGGVLQDGSASDEEQLSRLAEISRAGPRWVETPVEEGLVPWADQIYQ